MHYLGVTLTGYGTVNGRVNYDGIRAALSAILDKLFVVSVVELIVEPSALRANEVNISVHFQTIVVDRNQLDELSRSFVTAAKQAVGFLSLQISALSQGAYHEIPITFPAKGIVGVNATGLTTIDRRLLARACELFFGAVIVVMQGEWQHHQEARFEVMCCLLVAPSIRERVPGLSLQVILETAEEIQPVWDGRHQALVLVDDEAAAVNAIAPYIYDYWSQNTAPELREQWKQ